jgi:hypothetical protein
MVGTPSRYLMAPLEEPQASMDLTTETDSASETSPKTTWRPSSQEVTTVVMKNWEPLLWWNVSAYASSGVKNWAVSTYVLGPALAMERRKGLLWVSLKFSSANFSP